MNNDLNEIRIFTKVAHLLSFTKAAEALGVEKSTASSKINQLEARLGIRLLQRTTRSVSLTDAGSEYLSYCEQALGALQMGEDYIAELSDVPTGSLQVSVSQNFADFIMPTVITPFLERYPKVNLNIVQSSRTVDLIKEGFDVAVRSSADELQDSSLIYRKIFPTERILVASKSFIDKFGLAKTPEQLAQQPCVGIINENPESWHNTSVYWKKQKVPLKFRFAVNSMNSVKYAVDAGLGVGILPKRSISEQLDNGQLVEISSDVKIAPTSLYVVYASRSGQPAKLKAFVEALLKWGKSSEI